VLVPLSCMLAACMSCIPYRRGFCCRKPPLISNGSQSSSLVPRTHFVNLQDVLLPCPWLAACSPITGTRTHGPTHPCDRPAATDTRQAQHFSQSDPYWDCTSQQHLYTHRLTHVHGPGRLHTCWSAGLPVLTDHFSAECSSTPTAHGAPTSSSMLLTSSHAVTIAVAHQSTGTTSTWYVHASTTCTPWNTCCRSCYHCAAATAPGGLLQLPAGASHPRVHERALKVTCSRAMNAGPTATTTRRGLTTEAVGRPSDSRHEPATCLRQPAAKHRALSLSPSCLLPHPLPTANPRPSRSNKPHSKSAMTHSQAETRCKWQC
jgi:hypothetical protein